MNLEAAFSLLVLLCMAFYAARQIPQSAVLPRDDNTQRREWLLLLLIIPAAFLWTLAIPLVSDDFVSIGDALQFAPGKFVELFTIPATNRFFRPLGYLSLAVDARWTGRNPALWHLSALLMHFANCLLLYLFARQAGITRAFAAVAAVMFGIHGSRPEAATWIAGRFDLLATLFVLATLLLFLRGNYGIALGTAFLALISKESAYVLPVLLLLITALPLWRRVAPFAALTAAVFLYRWYVLSGIGGYQTAGNAPTIFNFSLLRTANALLLRLWATLFFPINWSEGPQWWLWIVLSLGVAGYAAIALSSGWQRRTIAFLCLAFVAALPVQHLLLIGADFEKSRVLYLPSVGFALFLASALENLRKLEWRIPAAIAIIAFQTACLEHNLMIWRDVAQTARRACDSVAAALDGNSDTVIVLGLPSILRGVYFLHPGMADCLEVGHGVDPRRIGGDHPILIFQWDPRSEIVTR